MEISHGEITLQASTGNSSFGIEQQFVAYLQYTAKWRLADMFDFAVNGCNMSLEGNYRDFVESDYARQIEELESTLIMGGAGREIVNKVHHAIHGKYLPRDCFTYRGDLYAPEYWFGWAIAQYQQRSGRTFKEIGEAVPVGDIRDMYWPYHEMAIEHFCEALEGMIELHKPVR